MGADAPVLPDNSIRPSMSRTTDAIRGSRVPEKITQRDRSLCLIDRRVHAAEQQFRFLVIGERAIVDADIIDPPRVGLRTGAQCADGSR